MQGYAWADIPFTRVFDGHIECILHSEVPFNTCPMIPENVRCCQNIYIPIGIEIAKYCLSTFLLVAIFILLNFTAE